MGFRKRRRWKILTRILRSPQVKRLVQILLIVPGLYALSLVVYGLVVIGRESPVGVAVLLGLIALAVWIVMWRRVDQRRIEDDRHCSECNYQVAPVGPVPERCPECGASWNLPGGRIMGQRTVRNRHLAAWSELTSRRLTQSQRQELIDVAPRMPTPKVPFPWVVLEAERWVGAQISGGVARPDQVDRYYGLPVSLIVDAQNSRWYFTPSEVASVDQASIYVGHDSEPAVQVNQRISQADVSPGRSPIAAVVTAEEPGTLRIRAEYRVRVEDPGVRRLPRPGQPVPAPKLLWSKTIQVTRDVTVLP
jgi:hypothetical protein